MVDLPDILTQASLLRQSIPCTLADKKPRHGGSHSVFEIIFEDSVRWAARVSHGPENWKMEHRAMQYLQHIKQQRPDLKAPNVFVKAEHPVSYSEWVSGEPLAIWNFQIPLTKRHRFLDDLAEFLLQLWTIHAPPASLSTRNHSPVYSAWLTESIDRGVRRTLAGTARWGDAIDYLIMRSMIPDYAAEFDECAGVGFDHGDLNAHNIMKSDDLQLTG